MYRTRNFHSNAFSVEENALDGTDNITSFSSRKAKMYLKKRKCENKTSKKKERKKRNHVCSDSI